MQIIERVERVCQSFIERERKIRFQDKCQKLAEILFESAVLRGVSWGSDYAQSAEGLVPEAHGKKHIRIRAKRGHWNSNTSLGPPSLAFPAYEILVCSYNEEAMEGGGIDITIKKDPDEIVELEFHDLYTKNNPYAKWEVTKKPGGFQGRFHDNIFDPEYVQRWIDNIGEWRFLR